jgi:hypothetical protein
MNEHRAYILQTWETEQYPEGMIDIFVDGRWSITLLQNISAYALRELLHRTGTKYITIEYAANDIERAFILSSLNVLWDTQR